jgi:shikimate dehydrogenase
MNEQSIPHACVMGHPIAQSRSPMLHGYWLKQLGLAGRYSLQDVAPDGFDAFFSGFHAAGYTGGNVTAPHKQAAMRAVARLEPQAASIGAVNTIWTENGVLVGGNTDCHGFIANLDDRAPHWQGGAKTAVLLGAGGATRAAIVALRARGLEIVLVNRTRANADTLAAHFNAMPGPSVSVVAWEDMAQALQVADLLVNTTVLGMLGKPALHIDLRRLKPAATVYDIVYVPLETGLLREARSRGHRVVDGLGMLLHQAVPGFSKWFGATPEVTPALRRLIEDDIRATTISNSRSGRDA